MKYGIISDIHSNIHALRSAIQEIEPTVDKIICLGDIVGYNAKPKECIRLVKNHPKIEVVVHGNHDMDASNLERLSMGHLLSLSQDASDGIAYSNKQLSERERKWLTSLPRESLVDDKKMPFWASHYSPEECTYYGYILSIEEASRSLKVFKEWGGDSHIFFFGHSHIPTFAEEVSSTGKLKFDMGSNLIGRIFDIKDSNYYLLNPGSIGQPRDSAGTSYGILDTKLKKFFIKGFQYNIRAAQKAVRTAGYSRSIANRLDPEHEKKLKAARKAKYKKQQKAKTGREKWV